MANRYLQKVKSASSSAVKKVKRSENDKKEDKLSILSENDVPTTPLSTSSKGGNSGGPGSPTKVSWEDQLPPPSPTPSSPSHSSPSPAPSPAEPGLAGSHNPLDHHFSSESLEPLDEQPEEGGLMMMTDRSLSRSGKKDKVNFKSLSSGLASFSKNLAHTAVEGSKTVVSATKSASAVIAEKAVEGSKSVVTATKSASNVIAEMASEGSKSVVSASKVASFAVVEATKNAGSTLSEKISRKNADEEKSGAVCTPNLPIEEEVANPAMFKIPLSQTILNEEGFAIRDVPIIITDMITCIIEKHWYEEEGLFRLSTNLHHMNALKRSYDLRKPINFSDIVDPHLASCTLKLFLRELPETVFTSQLQAEWYTIPFINNPETKKTKVKELLGKLPSVNRRTIEELFSLLNLVVEYKSLNKMTISNLGIVFIPALGLNSPDLFNFLIENCKELFGETLVSAWLAKGGPSIPIIPSSGPPIDIPLPPSDLPKPPNDTPPSFDIHSRRITSESSEGSHLGQEDSSEGSTTGSGKNIITNRTPTWASSNPRNDVPPIKMKSNSSKHLGSTPERSLNHSSPVAAGGTSSRPVPTSISSPNNHWLQRSPASVKRTITPGNRTLADQKNKIQEELLTEGDN